MMNQIKQKNDRESLFIKFSEFSRNVIRFSNRRIPRIEFLTDLSKMIYDFSKCDTIEIWMRDGVMFYRWVAELYPNENMSFVVFPKDFEDKTVMRKYFREDADFVQLCVDVMNRNIFGNLSFITNNGSIWVNESGASFSMKPDDNMNNQIRVTDEDYKSVSIIPFDVDEKNNGLLHLKSRNKNYFTKDEILFYEIFAQTFGVAIAHRRAQWALGERIKELNCLYEIKKIENEPRMSVDSFLKKTVNLLPPVWQYPEITCSRILFDGTEYLSDNFCEGPHKQSAEILVDNKKRGFIEIIYSENRPDQYEGPFLKEERNLLDTLAQELELIIERKQSEGEKLILQEQLRHADRLATLGQLAAGVAHEINEPVGNILGFAQLAQKNPGIPQQVYDDIEEVIKSSLHTREIVKKLLLFARHTPMQFSQIELNDIIEQSLYFYEHRCVKENIELVREYDPKLPKFNGDPSQLTQVVVNLVVNSIQAMPNGGKLIIGTRFDKKYIYFYIIDTGFGMSEETKSKLFLPFFTTKDINEGTGLGLAVVKDIVTAHEGFIKVLSEKDRGTSFEILFPINV